MLASLMRVGGVEKALRARSCVGCSSVASSVAATSVSRLRRPISGWAYFEAITSPCSVRRIWPFTVPGGCARIAW